MDDKIKELRIQNEQYLREHPEVDGMISSFLKHLLAEKPSNVYDCAVSFFTEGGLREKVEETK